MAVVCLNWAQMKLAADAGVMRQLSAIFKGRQRNYGASGSNDYDLHILGCQAEFAVAKYMNVYWCGTVGYINAKDAGGILQVRARTRADYDLILHPADPDGDPFILVFADPPSFHLLGWITASEGKQPEFWKDPAGGRPAFFVPQGKLAPVESLREIVNHTLRRETVE